MLILGLHMGHDASVTVLDDGRILGVYEKERHTGARHDFFVNADDILAACRMFGVDVADVDSFAVTSSQGIPVFFEEHDRFQFTVDWDRPIPGLTHPGSNLIEWYTKMSEAREPWARIRLEETLARGLQDGEVLGVPGRTRPIDWTESSALYAYENPFCPKIWHQGLTLETMRRAHPDGLAELMSHRAEQTGCVPLSVSLLGRDLPGVLVPHHLAHAASVYFTGTSDHAAILTVDGTFDSGVAGMGMGLFARGRGNKISAFLPNFLTSANFFFRVAAALRLTGELPGKLMGLSSYGERRFFRPELLENANSGYTQEILPEWQRFGKFNKTLRSAAYFLHRCLETAAEEKLPINKWHLALAEIGDISADRYAVDIAASAQAVFEGQMLAGVETLRSLLAKVGEHTDTLCLAGGGALNCVSNARVFRETPYRTVQVPPWVADQGLSIGSALFVHHHLLDNPFTPKSELSSIDARLGPEPDAGAVRRVAEAARARGYSVVESADAAGLVADDILNDKVVAWFDGRSEIGPRALGGRSILANPAKAENWGRVNRIKNRESWRPFAPAMLAETAKHMIDGAPERSPFMLFTGSVTSDAIPAVTHVDRTARYQTVTDADGAFHDLLVAMRDRGAAPVTMNTSLNDRGEPIIESPERALQFFETAAFDTACFNGTYVIRKPS